MPSSHYYTRAGYTVRLQVGGNGRWQYVVEKDGNVIGSGQAATIMQAMKQAAMIADSGDNPLK